MSDQDNKIPNHIGFIMDGNRRWAKTHGLPTYEGHLAGYNKVKDVVRASVDAGVKYVSFYAFSTENWDRTEKEISYLMKLFMRMFTSDLDEVVGENVRIVIAGTDERLDKKVIQAARDAEAKTAGNTRATVMLCFNYGGQKEIVDAVKKLAASGEEISEEGISKHLYAPDVPPCDIIVRTSGEQRLSNFMLWRAAYSELMFVDKHWPDMGPNDVKDVIKEYNSRSRRYGG
ncbi:di-trans,poly-cis-decaprenylcistransferase [Candidatus Saccharibacteria bacterium]|nr:di-trans,poly-cis-decaprenylcistransferase [Candidatus Saccharibacteria bacterium]